MENNSADSCKAQNDDGEGRVEREMKSEYGDADDSNIIGTDEVGPTSRGCDDFLPFWNVSANLGNDNQNLGSMADFTEAANRCKEIQSMNFTSTLGNTTMWAMATAKLLQTDHVTANMDCSNRCNSSDDKELEIASSTEDSLSCSHEEGMDALLKLFDMSIYNESDECGACSQNTNYEAILDYNCNNPSITLLTPRAKEVVSVLENSLMSDSTKVAAIERICPHWKENIQYTLLQTNAKEVSAALQRVKQARSSLEKMKEKILQAFRDRHHTLDLFEKTLEESMKILSWDENSNSEGS